jgi:DDE superfamily endonuclease
VSAQTYPGEVCGYGSGRATLTPDYGRHGSVWVLGAFEPATGPAALLCSPRLDNAGCIHLLELVLQTYPAREWVLITDNLTTHISCDTRTALLACPAVQLLRVPKSACWLNLIEPRWKPRRSLALKERRVERVDEVIEAIVQATAYWNAHRYALCLEKSRLSLEKNH